MLQNRIKPDFIFRGSKPVGVLLKIKDYEDILNELEDKEDIEYINHLKSKGIETIDFDEYLLERKISV
jgi:hypothetical protein